MLRTILITLAVLAVATVCVTDAGAQSARANAQSRWGQVWGTFVWQTQMGPDATLPALVSFHVDGTITGADATMFGAMTNATRHLTPFHGLWERTGWQTIGGTSLWLIYDSATGVLLRIGRSRSNLQFADDFNSFQGKMFVESLPCPTPTTCPDPGDPSAKWSANTAMPPDGFPVSGKRLERVPAGALPQ